MSDYWVSKKKYFCKYCEIYIADDAPSRQQHEGGLRHKGNLERFIKGIYKSGEKQKKDREEEAREMKRVEQAAAAAFAQDIGSGVAKASTSSTPKLIASASASTKPPVKPSNPYANYSTAESLGFTDPDAERIAAETEARRTQGVAGQWEVVEVGAQPVATAVEEEPIVGVKRAADALPPEEDVRYFKLQKKTLGAGLGELYDPGSIPIKIKKKEPSPENESSTLTGAVLSPEPSDASSIPKWTSISLKKVDATTEAPSESTSTSSGPAKWAAPQWSDPLPDVKPKDRRSIFGVLDEVNPEATEGASEAKEVKREQDIKTEEEAEPSLRPAGGSMFKKRRAPTNAGRGRRDV